MDFGRPCRMSRASLLPGSVAASSYTRIQWRQFRPLVHKVEQNMRVTRRTALFAGLAPLAGAAAAQSAPSHIERWGMFEAEFSGPRSGNPYVDVRFAADFRFAH